MPISNYTKTKALSTTLALYLDPEVVNAIEDAANAIDVTSNTLAAFGILFVNACKTAITYGLPKECLTKHFGVTEDEFTELLETDTEVKFTYNDKERANLARIANCILTLTDATVDERLAANSLELTAQISALEYISIPYNLSQMRRKAVRKKWPTTRLGKIAQS